MDPIFEMIKRAIEFFSWIKVQFEYTLAKNRIRKKKRIQVKEIRKLSYYTPMNSIGSGETAKYILNRLIRRLEEQREMYAERIGHLDLNDRNSAKVVGAVDVVFSTLVSIKQDFKNFVDMIRKNEVRDTQTDMGVQIP